MTMKKLGVLGLFVFAVGCGGGGGGGAGPVIHTLDANDPVDIAAGDCFLVAGATIPGGALTSYHILDTNADDMDIAVVSSAFGCNPTTADTAYTTGTGPGSGSGVVPATDDYNLVISCFNVVETCIPTVDFWDYQN
jgi:hypothetical protein